MRVLISGGAGFIGTHLCKHFLNKGCQVVCLDNFTSGGKENISQFEDNPMFELYEWNVENAIGTQISADIIYNLASPAAPAKCKEVSLKTLKANIIGTMNLLDLSLSCQIPLVHFSTIRIHESVSVDNPMFCYIGGKQCAESLCFEYNKLLKNVRVIRLFNVYGPGMALNDSRVIPTFIRKALLDEEISIFGTGEQIDSFMYVDDLLGYLDLGDKTSLVTLGSPQRITIKQLAYSIVDILGSKSKVVFKNTDYLCNNSREDIAVTTVKDWAPKFSLEMGILKTAAYVKEKLQPQI
jgi:UDP-glucuronate decarboxylase